MAPSGIEEILPPGPYRESVPRLALSKAHAVTRAGVGGIILAADTVVVVGEELLGKPRDAADARRMLRLLRGRAHEVITGVAILDTEHGREATSGVVTTVVMGHFDDAALEAYVISGGPLDKAGAYAIQEVPEGWVTSLVGSYTNVVGLPLAETRALLAEFRVPLLAPGSAGRGDDEL